MILCTQCIPISHNNMELFTYPTTYFYFGFVNTKHYSKAINYISFGYSLNFLN